MSVVKPDLDIGELADAAGLSRRAVRFYVQQGLISPPLGRGRGRHYDSTHLDQLRRIGQLQSAGHSLDAIRKIIAGAEAEPAPVPRRRLATPGLSTSLWTRLRLMEGVELHYDAAKFNPPVEKLLALREAVREIFAADDEHELKSAHGARETE